MTKLTKAQEKRFDKKVNELKGGYLDEIYEFGYRAKVHNKSTGFPEIFTITDWANIKQHLADELARTVRFEREKADKTIILFRKRFKNELATQKKEIVEKLINIPYYDKEVSRDYEKFKSRWTAFKEGWYLMKEKAIETINND